MKKYFNNVMKQSIWVLSLTLLAIFTSCSKMDDYREFAKGGEISYTGKLDSVKINSGKYRVVVNGLFIADPKVNKCVVYWNNKADSVVIPVVRTANVDVLKFTIPNITEGIQNFVIYTYDADGNRSVPVYKTARVYGDRYQGTLTNRGINELVTNEENATVIDWGRMDLLSGVFASELSYVNNNNQTVNVRVPIGTVTTPLINFKIKSSVRYRTLFLPDTSSVDTFYTDYVTRYVPQVVKRDITSTYLVNVGPRVTASAMSGTRWGTLAGWTSNASVKNFNGVGGYEFKNSIGVISMEAGWGLVNVPNGLIYQTINLPAGTYQFEALTTDQNTGGSRYLVAAAGSTLPDVANVTSSSIAFAVFSATSKKLTFTIPNPAQVSIGFAANLTGTGSTGQYFKVGSVKLYEVQYL